jgi:hypothetical protein
MPTNTATARADTVLPYINGITLSGRTLTYPSRSNAEERAVQWLIDDDLNTKVSDEQSLRQRYVLSTLWFLQPTPTNGFGSADHVSTWTTNINECEWSNVSCDGSGRVTSLYLREQNVQGQIPVDLGLLTDLTYLDLSFNQLSGTIPRSIGALKALMRLDLEHNQLSDTIPSSLGSLTALTLLYLYGNQLNGTIPSSLGALTALTGLSLWVNQLTGTIPSSLGNLKALTRLDLDDNKLNGTIPSSLGSLTGLNELYLFDNQLVGTMPFCNSDQQFENLVVDCMEVNCTCCTGCCPLAFGSIPVFSYCG